MGSVLLMRLRESRSNITSGNRLEDPGITIPAPEFLSTAGRCSDRRNGYNATLRASSLSISRSLVARSAIVVYELVGCANSECSWSHSSDFTCGDAITGKGPLISEVRKCTKKKSERRRSVRARNAE
jgi:hypothetical protein